MVNYKAEIQQTKEGEELKLIEEQEQESKEGKNFLDG